MRRLNLLLLNRSLKKISDSCCGSGPGGGCGVDGPGSDADGPGSDGPEIPMLAALDPMGPIPMLTVLDPSHPMPMLTPLDPTDPMPMLVAFDPTGPMSTLTPLDPTDPMPMLMSLDLKDCMAFLTDLDPAERKAFLTTPDPTAGPVEVGRLSVPGSTEDDLNLCPVGAADWGRVTATSSETPVTSTPPKESRPTTTRCPSLVSRY